MSKIEAGKYDLHPEVLDIAALIESCVRLVRGKAEDNGVHMDHSIDCHDGAEIVADERALKQIMLNLLSNAVKFTPAGGKISVDVAEEDNEVRLVVRDTGRGIPKDQIDRLGQPFEQIATDAKLSKQGTGLGLALVRSLAELHGGRMAIESELGKGTSVTVTLPKIPYCEVPAPEEEASPAASVVAG